MCHVPTGYKEIQGRQGPLLLERGGERARRSSSLPAPGALPRRAERLAGCFRGSKVGFEWWGYAEINGRHEAVA